jgi:rhamnulokinase
MATFGAVDVGASGGRVMAGVVDGRTVRLEPVHRFANEVRHADGHLRWDLTGIYDHARKGIDRISDAASIGIDTWGVDYGLIDDAGNLLAEPIAYRDDRTDKVIDDVHKIVPPDDLFEINGLQFLPFTTLYQFAAEERSPLWQRAEHAALLPDLLAYWLTGQLRTELTNASTTGLLDVRRREWSIDLLDRMAIPPQLLPEIEPPGSVRGVTDGGTPVVTVASHDTASAVVGVPATSERFAYVVSGTWSLVGLELQSPVLTEAARVSKFTNEVGIDGTTRFLRNVGGLWLLQECLRTWERNDLEALLIDAARLAPDGPRIDVDDHSFIPSGDMPQRIAAAAGRPELTPSETVRCIVESLASGYASTLRNAARITSFEIDVVHIVGGGSQNSLLCQLTADAVGLPVLAGPVEATALGNILVQARAAGVFPASLEGMRAQLASSISIRRYNPR